MFEQKTVVEQKPLKAATKIPVKNPKPNETSKVKELEINNQIKSENKTSVETPKTIIEESVKVKEVTETVLKNEAEKKPEEKQNDSVLESKPEAKIEPIKLEVTEELKVKPTEQPEVNKVLETTTLKDEHKVKEETKITDEHKVKEEHKNEEHKIIDEHKVKEEHKNEVHKITDVLKVKDIDEHNKRKDKT